MESPFLLQLQRGLQGEKTSSETLRGAFVSVDHLLTQLAQDLQIVYDGPDVGLGSQANLHRLRVAEQHWTGAEHAWGVAVCSYAGKGEPRSEWRIHRVSRERLPIILQALPAFFHGYHTAAEGAHPERASTRRLGEISRLFNA
ncbi:MAG: hypothetical protein U7M05_03535 [Candidatus Igneacidithiobacillus chanchocoensis]